MIKYIIKITKLLILIQFLLLGSVVVLNEGLHTKAAYLTISKHKLKKYAKTTQPLKTINGKRYCSSSHIRFKGKNFTVTNKHCCEAYTGFEENTLRIGNSLETILYKSSIHDVCILTAKNVNKTLRLAKKDVDMWDSILVMGYPRGFSLTPAAGTIISKNVRILVGNIFSSTFYESHEALVKILPGNSGSPVLNSNGDVVGLAYATYNGGMDRGVLVPLRFVKNALEQAIRVK